MVYPAEHLDPKTKKSWILLYVCCTCGLGVEHDPHNKDRCL